MLLVIAAYLAVRGSLPQLDGERKVAGITETVVIERDNQGIPVIQASSRQDLAFGTGFVHAQDRYFQMDLMRRKAAGELAALVGEAALPLDRRARLHRFRFRAGAAIANLSGPQRSILEAYVAGVNSGFDSLRVKPFEYLLLDATPDPWRIEDSVLVGYAMFLELHDSRASRDLHRATARLALDDSLFHYLYPAGTSWDAPLEGGPVAVPAMPGRADVDIRGRRVALGTGVQELEPGPAAIGSNSWAVSGRLTESGRAIVANDMHLGIATPNIWYRARLVQSEGTRRDVSGVTLPGTPVVVTGSNGSVAWAFTNSYRGWADAVLIRPGSAPGSYLTAGGERSFEEQIETIEIRGRSPEVLRVRETVWGPVLPAANFPDGDIAISWIAHHAEAVNFSHLELETVGSVNEAIEVANRIGIPPQNFVAGDSDGNIGWSIAGRLPRRSGQRPSFPEDWSRGAGWTEWLDPREYPRIVNPESGRIWTANARVVGDENLAVIGDGGYDLGARAMQIRDALLAQESFDVNDMLSIHLDDRAFFLERWRDLLLSVLDDEALRNSPSRAAYRRHVEDWLPRASADSVGYRLVREFRSNVSSRVFRMLVAAPVAERFGRELPTRVSNQFESPLWELVNKQPEHLLAANFDSWNDLMLEVVDAVIEHYQAFDTGLDGRTWGERNTAEFRHPLSRALPLLSAFIDLPADQLPGDSHMPRVQTPTMGASERFAVSPGAESTGYLHMPGGQSGHPLSPYFADGHAAWVEGLATPFLPGKASHELNLLPAGGL